MRVAQHARLRVLTQPENVCSIWQAAEFYGGEIKEDKLRYGYEVFKFDKLF
jgi:hypothetical protein